MSAFLFPWAFALAALAPVIVVMYLLKLKRRPQQVPSTLLWRRSVQDMIANAPFQRLRNNLLLWLQLLILALLVFALSRPVLRMAGSRGETIILLLDLSASMQTVEADGETRLEKARRLAIQAIDSMSAGNDLIPGFTSRDEMMIIGITDRPVPLQPLTEDRGALRAAVRAAQVSDTAADLTDLAYILKERTMSIVEGALQPNENARVILISDGALGDSVIALADVLNIDFISVGEASDNVGFVAVDVRESFSGNFEYQVFTSLFNSSAETRTVFVELAVEGEVLDLKKADIPPRATGGVVFTLGESVRGLATLRLVDHRDPYPLDDMVRANVAPPQNLDVLVVSRGNSFLESVFSIDPRTSVSRISPDQYKPSDEYEIVVFDNCTVPEVPAVGSFVFVNSLPPAEFAFGEAGPTIENPAVIDWSRVHPLTRYTNFERVLIGESRNLAPPPGAVPLVQALSTDLISYLETETQRVLVIGFDINRSYWPVDVSFPIFFANLIDTWARAGAAGSRPSYVTGETVPLVPPRDAARAAVKTPSGRTISYNLEGRTTIYLTETQEAGIYTVTFDNDAPRIVPVNPLSLLESDIPVITELSVAGRTVTASQGEVKTRQEIWHWLALAALGVLMLEWTIYCRRTFM